MKLTLEGLAEAIQSARSLENLQSELREALIERLIGQSYAKGQENTTTSGTPIQ
jgi:hypothetical protein